MNLTEFCRFWAAKAWRRALIAAFCVGGLFVVASGTERVLNGSSEFMAFRQIVQVSILQNKDHYVEVEHLRGYPPFFAIAWAPFGLLPVGLWVGEAPPPAGAPLAQVIQVAVSAAVVLLIMTLLAVWAARLIPAACGVKPREGTGFCASALLLVLSGGLMLNSVIRCETDMFVVILVAGGMYLMFTRERQGWGGALLGIAAAFKLTPGLFVIYLLCRRKWRALGGMVAAGIVCSVVLPVLVWGVKGATERTRSWVNMVIAPTLTTGPEQFIEHAYREANQSLKAATTRYLSHYNAGGSNRQRFVNVVDLPPATVGKITTALKLVILALLAAAWLLPRPGREGDLGPVLFALVPLGMVLMSDISVGGHLAILVVPIGILTAFCFRHADERIGRTMSWCVLAGFLLANLIAVRLLKQLSVGTAGVLFLLGVLLYLAFRLRRESQLPDAGDAQAPGEDAGPAQRLLGR